MRKPPEMIALLIYLALAAPGCNQALTPAAPAGQPIAASEVPIDAISKSFAALGRVKSFRMRVTNTGPDLAPAVVANKPDTSLIEIVFPDRTRIIAPIDAEPASRVEVINIGSASYFKAPGEAWTKMEVGDAGLTSIFQQFSTDPKNIEEFARSVSEARLIGRETLEGIPTLVYEFKSVPGIAGINAGKLWVGASDSLPRKLECTYPMTIDDKTLEQKATIVYYDFNAEIKIEPPIP